MIIKRGEEHQLPSFKSHGEARKFFQKKYGEENFKLKGSHQIDERKLYFYELKERQSVEIWEDGEIHIVY